MGTIFDLCHSKVTETRRNSKGLGGRVEGVDFEEKY